MLSIFKKCIILFAFTHVLYISHGQEQSNYDLLVRNNIKIIEAYVMAEVDSTDSFLITKEYFNKKGRTTLKEIYSRKGLGCAYSYFYNDDTLRTERITVCHGKFMSKTKIWYDQKNAQR